MNGFESLSLAEPILKATAEMGFSEPTPVQVETIPLMLEGKDVIAQAQTGTGKTAAFMIPILEKIKPGSKPSALVLVPTRELGVQVADEGKRLARFLEARIAPVYGGHSMEQEIDALRKGVDIVVGTPGRVIDHIKRGNLDLRQLRFLILDEADRMLDMGFIEDIEYIMHKMPKERNTYLFSATIPPEIRRLGKDHMRDPVVVSVSEDEIVLPSTEQIYFNVGRKNKIWALCRVLDKEKPKAIVFASTKNMVDIIGKRLSSYGYPAAAIHGDMTQARREKVLSDFRQGKIKVLVATDVAARGLDIEGVTHVINYDIPENPEVYVHRIGRTGRMGKEGRAITFVSADEKHLLDAIEDFADVKLVEAKVPQTKGKDVVREVLDFDEMASIFGMVRLRLNIGRADGLRINELMDIVTKSAKISDLAVGHIEIGDKNSEIEVHKDVAMRAIQALRQSTYKNKRITVEPLPRRG